MVAANDGNISVRIGKNLFLCTPTGVSKGFMTPEYICKVDGEGKVIQANPVLSPPPKSRCICVSIKKGPM